MELEREQNDLLIIAHESVLRVLYGYLMACNATDIPALSFPRNEIIEIIPASYNNEATRITIPGIEDNIIPASPEDIKIPVPPSGTITRKICCLIAPRSPGYCPKFEAFWGKKLSIQSFLNPPIGGHCRNGETTRKNHWGLLHFFFLLRHLQ